MAKRWWIAAVVVTATLAAGCSSGTTTAAHSSGAGSPSTSTSAAASPTGVTSTESGPVTSPDPRLDSSRCVEVTGANLDLLTASDKDAARKAADTLERYNPPSPVRSAIEYFVSTGGAHFDDPDYTRNNQIVKSWVDQVCPT